MDLGLAGKTALVTGAGRGIGAAIALTLAREGCDLALVDRGEGATAAVASACEQAGRRVRTFDADVTDFALAGRVVEETRAALGGLEALVCCAGITRDAMSWKMSEEDWDAVLAVNLKGYFNYCRAAARVLKAQGRGRIVLVASINGLRGKVGQANYAAAKAGGIALAKTLAKELGRYGVNVNVVAPGLVDTEMTRQLPREVFDRGVAETLLGRAAMPDDVADMVAFLCSARARHVTGAVVRVDGGQYV